MTIAFLISSGGFYGTEGMLIVLMNSLRALGCRPILGVLRNAQNPHTEIADRAKDDGIEVEIIECTGRADLQALLRVRDFCRRSSAAILHTHGYKADIYGYAASRSMGIPVIATCHNWTNDTRSVQIYAALDRWVLSRFPVVAAVSPAVAEVLARAGVSGGRIRVIANGIEAERFRAATPDRDCLPNCKAPVIGMVGRLVPNKGFLHVVKAAPRILARFPDALFLFAGEGPQRSELEAAARSVSISHAFYFAGARSDIERLYAAMDVFVLPSLNEGMPMSILEAMAAEKPVVATAVGAIPDVVRPPSAGLLVAPGDEEALAIALITILENPTEARRMGTQGYERVRHEYSSNATATEYLSLYRGLIQVRHVA